MCRLSPVQIVSSFQFGFMPQPFLPAAASTGGASLYPATAYALRTLKPFDHSGRRTRQAEIAQRVHPLSSVSFISPLPFRQRRCRRAERHHVSDRGASRSNGRANAGAGFECAGNAPACPASLERRCARQGAGRRQPRQHAAEQGSEPIFRNWCLTARLWKPRGNPDSSAGKVRPTACSWPTSASAGNAPACPASLERRCAPQPTARAQPLHRAGNRVFRVAFGNRRPAPRCSAPQGNSDSSR